MSKLFSESLGWIRRSLSEHESVHETKSAPPPDTNNPRVATAAVKQLSVGSEGSSTAGGADPPPPLIDAGNGDDDDFDDELEMVGDSVVLTRDDCLALNLRLPPRLVGSPWRLVFSTDRDGFSLKSVYRKMEQLEKDAPALIAIRDTDDCCFGALVSHNLRVTEKFYGTGESFLFRIRPEFKVRTGSLFPIVQYDLSLNYTL